MNISTNKNHTTCLINGVEMEYDMCDESIEAYKGVRRVYLGKGTIYRVNGVVQSGSTRVLHFWKRD